MINVNYEIKKGKAALSVSGHAGFAPKGQDIVCAAVSALSLAIIKLIRSYYGRFCWYETKEGVMRLSFPLAVKPEIRTQMIGAVNMFVRGIAELERLYPAYVYFETDYLPLWVRYIDTPEKTAEKRENFQQRKLCSAYFALY